MMSTAALLPLVTLNANSDASINAFQDVDGASCNMLHSIDEALRIPTIAALFDENSQALVQLDYADFEAVVRPHRLHARSEMWALSVDLLNESSSPSKCEQSLRSALDSMQSCIAPQHELLNVLTVFSCDSRRAVVQLVGEYQKQLSKVLPPHGMYGIGVVADESASIPRMTLVCVTQPIS